MGIYSRSYALSTAAAETCGCVGRAGDVRGSCYWADFAEKIRVLCLLTQLEVSGEKFSVAVFEFVAECLNSVCVDKCSCCLTFSVNGGCDVASVLSTLVANCVDVAVGFAIMLSYGLFIPYLL